MQQRVIAKKFSNVEAGYCVLNSVLTTHYRIKFGPSLWGNGRSLQDPRQRVRFSLGPPNNGTLVSTGTRLLCKQKFRVRFPGAPPIELGSTGAP